MKRSWKKGIGLAITAAVPLAFVLLQPPSPQQTHWERSPMPRKLSGVERKAASAERYIAQRMYGLGYIPQDAEIHAVDHVRTRMIPAMQAQQSLQKSSAASLVWKNHGPGNIGGRLRGVVVHPDNPNIIYVGSVSGGVWKSTDRGVSWFPTMNDLITLNISALVMKPGDPNTLYAGTGEGFFFTDNLPGRGILKTMDGGNTWKRVHIAQGLNSPFITAIAVSPAEPNVVYAAGRQAAPQRANIYPPLPVETIPDRGVSAIFKSVDGGETWQDVTKGKGIDHNASIINDDFPADVVVSPTDANVVYAAFGLYGSGGIWKSINGGQTWSRLRSGLPNASLRNMGYGRIKLAMAPSDPDVIYASFAYDHKSGDTINLMEGATLGIWKTTDGGQLWTQVTTPLTINQHNRNQNNTTALGQQGNYAHTMIVHPTDPNTVFVGGLDIYKTTEGGNTWSQVSMWIEPGHRWNPENLPYAHGDHHVLAFDHSTDPPTLYNGSDGGVARSRDLGTTWEVLNKDLGVTQFYTFAVHPTNPDIMMGGTQDTGTPMLLSGQDNLWHDVTGADGWQAYFDYADPTRIYVAQQQLTMFRATIDYAIGGFTASKNIGYNGGSNGITQRDAQKADFFPPYELSPNDPKVLVLGTNRVLQSKNRGDSWTAISAEFNIALATVAIGEGNDSVIWVGAYDGKVFKTENNGTNWTQVTHPNLPTRFITDIEFDPSNINTVYLTYSGYGAPHVFKTTDAGASWTNLTSNLPDIPANTIQVHPQQPYRLFLGTDIGVFMSEDGGQTWQPCMNGLPTVQVAAIVLNTNTNRVYAATHGRGVYSAKLDVGEHAELNVAVDEISLQMQPGYSRSATFTISNTGNANLSYSIMAAEPSRASGASLAKLLSNLANANPHRLPKLDLAAARTPLAKGVASALFTKSASAATSPASTTGADVLVLDDADNSADTFLGLGSGNKKGFTWSNVFSLHEFGFRLESFDFFMRTELVAVDTFYFAIMDANGQIFAQGNSILPSSINGGWFRIPLFEPLTFNADSSFSIAVGVTGAIGFPAGTDVDASVPKHSFYFDHGLSRYVPLDAIAGFENAAFLIRANGSKAGVGSRLSVSPASGTVAPGASQTITVTFDAQGLAEGKYYGHLNLTSNGGEHTVPVAILVSNTVHVDDHSVAVPAAFQLEQNYPNPFNPETSIRYVLPHEGNITLAVFDLNGRRVASLESGLKTAGQHVIRWNGRDSVGNHVPSGVYFYRLEATSASGAMTTLTKKMTVMK